MRSISISIYIYFKREKRDSILLSLKSEMKGVIMEISDVLNIIVFRVYLNDYNLSKIKSLSGVINITDKAGNQIES